MSPTAWLLLGALVLLSTWAGLLLLLAQTVRIRRQGLRLQEQLSREHLSTLRQVQALLALAPHLERLRWLPPLGDWAVAPDFASLLLDLVAKEQPRVILELGGGVSTLLVGHAIQEREGARLISLEHDPTLAARLRERVRAAGLERCVTVIHAPLEEQRLPSGCSQAWYSLQALQDLRDVDLVIVDGPPAVIDRLARRPALPLLWDRVTPQGVWLVDDASREREMLDDWCRDRPELQRTDIECERGATILRRGQAP